MLEAHEIVGLYVARKNVVFGRVGLFFRKYKYCSLCHVLANFTRVEKTEIHRFRKWRSVNPVTAPRRRGSSRPRIHKDQRIALLLLFAKEALITRFINSFLTQVRYFHHSRSIQLSPRRNRATSKSPPLAIPFSRLPFPKHVADLEFCISNANLIYSGKRRYKKFQREEILNEHFFKIKLS